MIDEITMRELSHEALHRLADQHEEFARKLRAAAHQRTAAVSRYFPEAKRREVLSGIPLIHAGYMAAGLSYDAAIRATMDAMDVKESCVRSWLGAAEREIQAQKKQARDAEIIRLAVQEKLGSREIAEQVGVHFTTAARVISRRRATY